MNPTPHYHVLRRAMGILGIALPFIQLLIAYTNLGCGHLQPSISACYYTQGISVFCGSLFAIGLFLLTYQGPPPSPTTDTKADIISSRLAGVLALGIAVFPTTAGNADSCTTQIQTWWQYSWIIHMICAVGCFGTLAYIALCIFTKTDPVEIPKPEKLFRNRIYRLCGASILLFMTIAGVFMLLQQLKKIPEESSAVFICETVMLIAFGTSWLVKGETLFTDGSKSFQRVPEIFKP